MSSELLGRTLGERFRVDALIGEGTFAEVYHVIDLHRQVPLAAKILRSDIARDSTLLERFRREAEVLARLQHPHIVRFYDILNLDGLMTILMDFIPGRTLDVTLTETPGPLRPSGVLRHLTPLASALHYAHLEHVIHRDLKPANILLHENGTLFVTDFGIARLLNVSSELTLRSSVGTPLYMAPEQIRNESVAVTTDIYALGVLLYRMVTGQVPFRGDSPDAAGQSQSARVTYEHLNKLPIPPIQLNSRLDLAVQDIILRCLEKDPTRRFESVLALYDAFAEAIGAPPMAGDAALTGPPSEHGRLVPTDLKPPEWSQFIPQVGPSEIHDSDPLSPVAQAGPMPTIVRSPRTPMIEHPAPQPPTRPHLEQHLQSASPTILRRNAPAPTSASADSLDGRPTPRRLVRPTETRRARARPEGGRRRWDRLTLLIGVALVLGTLCAAAAYVAGLWPSVGDKVQGTFSAPSAVSTLPPAGSPSAADLSKREGGTRVAFDSRRDGSLGLYIMDLDGTGLLRLTNIPGAARGPAWSPDRRQIAYYGASDENGIYDIFVVNADGTGVRNLTDSPGIDDKYPTWSPDGLQLAFHSNAGGDYEIAVIGVDGSGLRAITDNEFDDLGPDWSPDGTHIAYHSAQWDFPYEIAVIELASGRVRRLTDNNDTNSFPTWSPDGRYLAYNAISSRNAEVNISVLSFQDGSTRQLTNTSDRNAFPDWSPDGRQIIFQCGQPDVSAICVVSTDGTDRRVITDSLANFLPDWEPFR